MKMALALGWTKTSAFRYIATLVQLGYLELEEETRLYRPTAKVLRLGFAFLNRLSFVERAKPHLERLSRRFDQSVNMAILDDTEIVYVARIEKKRFLSINLNVGGRFPVHCTSMGKVLVAFLDESEREATLAKIVYTQYTPKTVANAEAFRKLLVPVRELGYAINDQEMDLGLRSCSVPIIGPGGKILSAINLSVSSAWVDVERLMREFVPALLETGREIMNDINVGQEIPAETNHQPSASTDTY